MTVAAVLAVIAGCPTDARPFQAGSGDPSRRQAPGLIGRRGQRKLIMKRTYQASKVRRARTHGFLVRMKSRGGRAVINARRAKGRKRLAV